MYFEITDFFITFAAIMNFEVNIDLIKRNADGYNNPHYDMIEDFWYLYKFKNPSLQLICDVIFAVLNNAEAKNKMSFLLFKNFVAPMRDYELKDYYYFLLSYASLDFDETV